MKKTMFIPKGKECQFESLICENIIVNGALRVDGEVRTKHIRGKGFLHANVISAKSVTASTIDAGTIICDRLIAERVAAVEIHAVESAAVSSYIEADLVKAGRITIADSAIADLVADEIIQLQPKHRGLLGTLFASYIRSKWTALFYRASKETKPQAEDNEPPATEAYETESAAPISPEVSEMERLMNDPEFMRLKAMYQLSQQVDYIWQLRPRENPHEEGRAVTLVGDQFDVSTVEKKTAA